jgi:hypothetical protein
VKKTRESEPVLTEKKEKSSTQRKNEVPRECGELHGGIVSEKAIRS